MTTTTAAPATRFSHFHTGVSYTDKQGVTHASKGRLVATIATRELDDGTIAVGVARVNPGDNPVRFAGRQRSEARLERLLATMRAETLKPSQEELMCQEKLDLLAFRMNRDTFIQKVVKENLFRQLSQATNHDEIRRLNGDLRSCTL
jgi:hypothetical protein